jgi:hypothetical protein
MLQQDGKVYFTEEEWIARRARRDAKNPGSGGSGGSGSNTGGNGGRGGGARGRGRGGGRGPQKTDECRRCGKLGHWARECRSKAKKEQAHFTQDEEAALMVVRATLTRGAAAVSETDAAAAAPGGDAAGGVVAAVSDCGAVVAASGGDVETALEIREEKVFMQLGQPEAGLDATIWIVDTGATNHMTGSHAAFIDLDTRVRGTVRFSDDSAAEIEGRGKVEFVCKNGERRVFGGVLYIPKLSANIISAGRLDEEGYQVVIGAASC